MRIRLFCLVFAFCICSCKTSEKDEKRSLVSVIEGFVPTLDGKMVYLVEAHHWQKRLDSTVVKEGHFRFSLPHDSTFAPFKVSIQYDDSLAPIGIAELSFNNEFLKPKEGQKSFGNSAFYLEEDTVFLAEVMPPAITDSMIHQASAPVPLQKVVDRVKSTKTKTSVDTLLQKVPEVRFKYMRRSYPDLRIEVRAGKQTEVMYKGAMNSFGWIGQVDSLKRVRLLKAYGDYIKANPFSYVLLDDIYNYRSQYSKTELRNLLGLFNQDVQESRKGDQFLNYLDIRLDPGEPIPELVLRDINGSYRAVTNPNTPVNMIILWASWCGPCRQEIPMLKEVEAHFRNRGINIASISIDKTEEYWKKAVAEEKMPWNQFIVDSANIDGFLNVLNVQGIPVIFLIDGQNARIKRYDGSDNSTKQQLIDLIESQLGAGWKLN